MPPIARSHTSVLRLISALLPIILAAALAVIPPFTPGPSIAHAEADSFGLGNGQTGARTITAPNTIVNSYAQVTAPLAPGDTSISVSTLADFAAGDLVMILQTTGIVPVPSSGASGPFDLSADPVGRWELARLASASGATLTLTAPLLNSYAATASQVIRVPEYTTLTINAGTSITAPAWNGATGGVLAFLVSGTITNNGTIRASGLGFRGGSYVDDTSGSTGCTSADEPGVAGARKGEGIANTRYGVGHTGNGNVANAGGGGVCLKSGGGGGGNAGAGGRGGYSDGSFDGARNVGGLGGAVLSYSLLDHLTLGGGGGAGHGTDSTGVAGGNGGGAIFVRAGQLAGSGLVLANGNTGSATTTDGGSGGGAGGSIYFRIAGSASCNTVTAIGGIGGSVVASQVGPGGGGGGGRVLFQSSGGTCPISVSGAQAGTQQDAGAPGGISYGAQAGAIGTIATLTGGFTSPATPTITTPAGSSLTNNQRPMIAGTASVNQTILIYLDGAQLAQTTSNASGDWSYTPLANMTAGTHQLQVAAEFQSVRSATSAPSSFTIDLSPPSAPAIDSPAQSAAIANSRPAIAGTAEPTSTVTIYLDGVALGTTTTDSTGSWSFTPSVALPDGVHTIKATATDLAGNTGGFSGAISFAVDTTLPAAPVVVSPASGAFTNQTRPAIAGTAEPTSTVTLYLDGVAIGTTTADSAGGWSFTPSVALPDGVHTIKATATDSAGNSGSFSSTNSLTVDTAPPPAPGSISPISGTTVYTATPTLSGTAEPYGTITIYLDGVAIGTTTADGSGAWSYTLSSPLTEGLHTVKVGVTDAAGNSSLLSSPNTLSYTPAHAPALTSTVAGAGAYGTAYSHLFAFTGTPTPTLALLSGTLPPGLSLNGIALSGVPTAAGSYGPITIKVSNGYGPDATQTFTIAIAKATLTATAHNHSRLTGAPNPPFTAHYSGFIGGDTAASAITGQPSCASTATLSSPASSYPIHCAAGTLVSSNYAFTFVDGTLTVTEAPSDTTRRLYLPLLQNQ